MTSKKLFLMGIMATAAKYIQPEAPKYHTTKVPQTEEEKQYMLAKAQAKRERKAMKKRRLA